jgi:hypothetical protein
MIGWLEHLAWLRVICYSTLAMVFLYRALHARRYRWLHLWLVGTYCVAIGVGLSTLWAPELVPWGRALQTPLLLGAALSGIWHLRKDEKW